VQQAYKEALHHFQDMLDIKPQGAAFDMHPSYNSSALARSLEVERYFEVQHHHAHFCSCLGENGIRGSALGVVLDGTGYGTDGALWGFELLKGDYQDFQRLAHLQYVPLPGADAAIKNPWRIAAAYLKHFLGLKGTRAAQKAFAKKSQELEIILWQLEEGFNIAQTCGCGRLFDAVAAFLGICLQSDYEGQAAAGLGEMAWAESKKRSFIKPYYLTFKEGIWDPTSLWYEICLDITKGVEPGKIALKFHFAVIEAVVEGVSWAVGQTGINTVALSGGVWQNRLFSTYVPEKLHQLGYTVLKHRFVPANDGGISLGQALIAAERW